MLRKSDDAYKRMVEEQEQLEARINALDKMIQRCRHHRREDITLDELHLMEEQLDPMREYNSVLKIRIFRVKE